MDKHQSLLQGVSFKPEIINATNLHPYTSRRMSVTVSINDGQKPLDIEILQSTHSCIQLEVFFNDEIVQLENGFERKMHLKLFTNEYCGSWSTTVSVLIEDEIFHYPVIGSVKATMTSNYTHLTLPQLNHFTIPFWFHNLHEESAEIKFIRSTSKEIDILNYSKLLLFPDQVKCYANITISTSKSTINSILTFRLYSKTFSEIINIPIQISTRQEPSSFAVINNYCDNWLCQEYLIYLVNCNRPTNIKIQELRYNNSFIRVDVVDTHVNTLIQVIASVRPALDRCYNYGVINNKLSIKINNAMIDTFLMFYFFPPIIQQHFKHCIYCPNDSKAISRFDLPNFFRRHIFVWSIETNKSIVLNPRETTPVPVMLDLNSNFKLSFQQTCDQLANNTTVMWYTNLGEFTINLTNLNTSTKINSEYCELHVNVDSSFQEILSSINYSSEDLMDNNSTIIKFFQSPIGYSQARDILISWKVYVYLNISVSIENLNPVTDQDCVYLLRTSDSFECISNTFCTGYIKNVTSLAFTVHYLPLKPGNHSVMLNIRSHNEMVNAIVINASGSQFDLRFNKQQVKYASGMATADIEYQLSSLQQLKIMSKLSKIHFTSIVERKYDLVFFIRVSNYGQIGVNLIDINIPPSFKFYTFQDTLYIKPNETRILKVRLRLPLSRRFSSCVLHATVKSDNLHPKIGINLKFSLSKSSQLYPSNLYLDLDIFKYRINVFLIFLLVSTFAAAKIHADSYIKQYAKLIERPEMSKKNQSIDLRSLAKAYTSSISNNTVNQISVATNIQSIKSTIKSTKQKKIKISDISQNDDTIDSIDEPISAIAEPVIEDDDKQTVNESKTTILSTELRDSAFEMNANHKSLDNIQTADSEMERELSSSIGSYKYSNIVHGKFSTDLANDYNDDEQSYIKNIVEHSAGSVGLYPLERTTVSDVDDGCAVLDMLNKELSESHQIYTNKYCNNYSIVQPKLYHHHTQFTDDSVFYPRSSPRPASRTMIRNTCNREYGHWSTELYGSNNRNCEDLSEPKDFNVIPETSNSSSRWKTSFGYSIPSLLKNVFENHQHHPWSRWTDVDQAPPGFQQKSSKWSIWEDKEFTE